MTDETKRAIVEFARRFASDLTLPELAVHLQMPYSAVCKVARGIEAETKPRSVVWRERAVILANQLHARDVHWDDIAEMIDVSRQYLVTCRAEVERGD